MKINNVSTKTSAKTIAIASLSCVILTVIILICYFTTTQVECSVSNFINWYISTFNNTRESMSDDKWTTWVLFVIIPLAIYGWLVLTIWQRHLALKEFNSKLNLKSVEFLQGRINFNFNQPQCNIVCSYNDIEKLKMIVHTIQVRTKNGSYPAVSEIELQFSILNNKTFVIKNTPNNIMNFIYSIIDYSRGMQNFSYRFAGYMEIKNIKEKIEDYLHKGFKQILSNSQESSFKTLSIIFFIIATMFLFSFADGLEDAVKSGFWPILIIPSVFAIVSFVFDFILIADKIKERNHKI